MVTDDTSGNTYNVYQQEIPEIDMYTHLLKWIALLESHLSRKLEPDDYIFPHFSSNGIPDPAREMTHDMVQSIITRFTSNAGLTKAYTTHCFRRGGAQYRFMYAPIGKRWSLSKIRWWGGWAIGEHVSCHCYAIQSRSNMQLILGGYPGEVSCGLTAKV